MNKVKKIVLGLFDDTSCFYCKDCILLNEVSAGPVKKPYFNVKLIRLGYRVQGIELISH